MRDLSAMIEFKPANSPHRIAVNPHCVAAVQQTTNGCRIDLSGGKEVFAYEHFDQFIAAL